MIDTATYEVAKGAVGQTLGHAKEQAQEALGDLSGRVMENDVVQQLSRRARKELKHAQHELRKAKKHAKKAAPSSGRSKGRRSRQVFVFFTLAGAVAVVAYLVQRRRSSAPLPADVAPDPFGAAVREEERAGVLAKPVATPGA
jgi:hypothetical protein